MTLGPHATESEPVTQRVLFVPEWDSRYRVQVYDTDAPFGIGPFVFWRYDRLVARKDSVGCAGVPVFVEEVGTARSVKYQWAYWWPCTEPEPTGALEYRTGEWNIP